MRKNMEISAGIEEALKTLYGDDTIYDLSFEGYTQAMRRLRKNDQACAGKVERTLKPLLETRIFPRRAIGWNQGSQGMKARLSLLPDNPHLIQDVKLIRSVLGIPDGHITIGSDDPRLRELVDIARPQTARRMLESDLSGPWLHVHVETATGGDSLRDAEQFLTQRLSHDLGQSARMSAQVDLDADGTPDWLRHEPDHTFMRHCLDAPLYNAALRLAVRHNLPRHAVSALIYYILTLNPEWITNVEPYDVDVTWHEDAARSNGFSLKVEGMDEFSTTEDWEHIRELYIKPWQQYRMEQRGMAPKGKRSKEVKRLKDALPWYKKMVSEEIEVKDVLREHLGDPDPPDQETLRRALSALQDLLKPQ